MFGAALTSIQRLTIAEQTATRLILREQPRLEWLAALALLLGTVIPFAMNLTFTAVATLAAAILVAGRARTRDIILDQETGKMTITFQNVLGKRTANEFSLSEIQQVYLKTDERGSSQIILVMETGESGLSVYSKDATDWKNGIVYSVNDFLKSK